MLELYYFPTATCGLKARLAAEEKGVDYISRVLDRDAGALNTPAYRALNPQGVVPTLVHDGRVFVESSIIMHYLDDAFSGPGLMPDSPGDRAGARLWMKRADESYLPALGALTYALFVRHKAGKIARGPAGLLRRHTGPGAAGPPDQRRRTGPGCARGRAGRERSWPAWSRRSMTRCSGATGSQARAGRWPTRP